jgi:DNA-directed RNA polymerase specialized sigma24 family protein
MFSASDVLSVETRIPAGSGVTYRGDCVLVGNPPVRGRDRIAVLIEQFCSPDRRTTTELQLCQAVHDAVFGLCLAMLESQDAAREAEQETWRKFLIHLGRSNDVSEIHNGTAYVRSIGRNVCAAMLMARVATPSGLSGGFDTATPPRIKQPEWRDVIRQDTAREPVGEPVREPVREALAFQPVGPLPSAAPRPEPDTVHWTALLAAAPDRSAKGARLRHLRLCDARHARRIARLSLPWRRRPVPMLALILALSWPAAVGASAS